MSDEASVALPGVQMAAFLKLIDIDTASFRLDLSNPESHQALRELDTAATSTFAALTQARRSAGGTTVCQGICLLSAVLHQNGLLRPAWLGPPCDLAQDSVRMIVDFRGGVKREV